MVETKRPIDLNRPWQNQETVAAGCSFCDESLDPIQGNGWWIAIRNKSPIYPKSYLLLPRECRADFEPKRDITEAYDLAQELTLANRDYWLVVKQGGLSGQTVGHLHFHLIEHAEKRVARTLSELIKADMPLVLHGGNCTVRAGGHRTGQCFVLPKRNTKNLEIEEVAMALEKLVRLGKHSLQSIEGLEPEFQITLSLVGKYIRYGTYLPVLYQFGVELVALLEGRALHLPWSHRESARHLRAAMGEY